jgi:hypothetical protein
MARKPGTRAEYVLFDVVYEDGTQRSNRGCRVWCWAASRGRPARTIIANRPRLPRNQAFPRRHQECPPRRGKG